MKKKLLALISMAACSFGLTACGNGEDLGEAMAKASLNTVIGMGTVFIVLILISLIIYCFNVIPKIQGAFTKKKTEGQAVKEEAVSTVQAEEPEVDETDDLELVAVIAAAIAAYEGAASTDGFVVRSVIRRPR